MSIDDLRDLLARTPPGPVPDMEPLLHLLASCWGEIAGSGDQAMAPHKLRRMEQASWDPPFLTFVIERHGGTAMASTRAELQRWTVDVEAPAAECESVGHRQVRPMQAPLDVRPLADEIARLIVSRADDPRLRWRDDGSVRVLIGKIIPSGSTARQTLEGRRRRFRTALAGLLESEGWRVVRANVYESDGGCGEDRTGRETAQTS